MDIHRFAVLSIPENQWLPVPQPRVLHGLVSLSLASETHSLSSGPHCEFQPLHDVGVVELGCMTSGVSCGGDAM